jgi:TDG/mug DNA glycosylase family protein
LNSKQGGFILQPIPDYIGEHLKILFVGYNPSIRSAETGYHYANPSNRFWKILHRSGLTQRLYRPEENHELLDKGYGFTNIVARPSKTAAEISREEYAEGREILKRKLQRYRPRVVCYVGKGVYEQFSGRRNIQWGKQPESVVAGIIDFVAPSSSGLVRMRMEEVAEIFSGIKAWL